MFGSNIKYTDLGRKDQSVVVGDIVSGRTKSVTVKGCPEEFTVGEKNCRRAVPGLHHGCIVMIEILLGFAHEPVVLPGLGDQRHHCKRQIHSVHVEKLKSIVEHCGVRSACRDNGIDLALFRFEKCGVHGLFTGKHSVGVTSDGVDLTVMCDESVRMSSLPAGKCIGGES